MTLPKLDISHPIKRYKHPVALVERIRALVSDGDAAQAIALLCQPMTLKLLTRNAVIGMIHRHKMTGPRINQSLVRKPKTERPSRAKMKRRDIPASRDPLVIEALEKIETADQPPIARAPAPMAPEPERASSIIPSSGITFFNLKPRHCRWPMNLYSPLSATHFCGETNNEGSYCEEHRRMARPR